MKKVLNDNKFMFGFVVAMSLFFCQDYIKDRFGRDAMLYEKFVTTKIFKEFKDDCSKKLDKIDMKLDKFYDTMIKNR